MRNRLLSTWIWPEDEFECKYIIIDDPNCGRREGVGLVCKSTSVQWIGNSKLVFENFVRDINHQIDICSYGLMYTLIEFTDAFSKYMIK